MTAQPGGRFTEQAVTQVMRQVAGQLGVEPNEARLLQLTNNAVFALPAAGLVIRVTRSHVFHDRVQKIVRLGHWFTQVDAPTIRLLTSVNQPLRAGDLLATVWHYIEPTPPAPTMADLGHTLRGFHQLGTPPFPLPAWDPVGDARARLADAEALDEDDHAFLQHWCDELEPHVTQLNQQAAPGLVHADAITGNLLRTPHGRVVLCDFDATCLGPWQVDLAAVATGEARFGRAGAHAALAAAYGYDVTTDPHWQLLRQARELKLVVAAVPLLASAPGVADEFRNRLRSIAQRDQRERWTPYAELTD
jgi:hypothetical protein